MKKVLKKADIPPLLRRYKEINPTATWDQFRASPARKREIKEALLIDQGGLCAYCEIDLLEKDESGDADLRVEHFHPKTDTSTTHNWHLDWNNLMACCHGGSNPNVRDAVNRSTSPDHSCDVPKEDTNLDGIILNPLEIPHSPALFRCERTTGSLKVHEENCNAAAISQMKAQKTIDELRLDANRLKRLRKEVLDTLNQNIGQLLLANKEPGEAREQLAKALLKKDENDKWPRFFTSIRAYLGSEAEKQLIDIGYTG